MLIIVTCILENIRMHTKHCEASLRKCVHKLCSLSSPWPLVSIANLLWHKLCISFLFAHQSLSLIALCFSNLTSLSSSGYLNYYKLYISASFFFFFFFLLNCTFLFSSPHLALSLTYLIWCICTVVYSLMSYG